MADDRQHDRQHDKRKAKKSETLEVRLPHETKRDFIERCRANGTNASEVVRTAIERYLKGHPRPVVETETRISAMIVPFVAKKKRLLAAGVGGVALAGFLALPSAAGPDLKAAFGRLDANGDGRLSIEEFTGSGSGESRTVVERRSSPGDDGNAAAPAAPREIRQDAFAVVVPPEDGSADGRWGVEMSIMRSVTGGGPDAPPLEEPGDPRLGEFAGMDVNGDGDVSFDEFQGRMRMLFTHGFELLDGDHDGALTMAEFALSAQAESLLQRPGEPAPPVQPEMKPARVKAGFEALDGDADGRVTLAEYLAAM